MGLTGADPLGSAGEADPHLQGNAQCRHTLF